MPDTKLTGLTSITGGNVDGSDLLYLVRDTGGTPQGRKITVTEFLTLVSGGGGANTALSNLASVAINTSLISDANNTDDLGSSGNKWRSGYFGTSIVNLGLSTLGNGTFTGAGVPSGVDSPTVLSVAKGTSVSPNSSANPVVSISDVFSGDPADGAGRVSIHTTLAGAVTGDVETLSVTARQTAAVNSGGLVAGYFRTIVEVPGTTASHFGGASTDQWYVKADNTSWEFDIDNQCSRAISNATNATPIVITTTASHTLATGDRVTIASVGGNTAANGTWAVTVINSTSFSLDTSVGNGAYTSGGTMVLLASQDYGTAGARSQGIIIAGLGLGKHTAGAVIDATSAASAFYTGLDIRPSSIDSGTGRAIRIPNATSIYGWNAAVNASVQLIGLDPSDRVSIASGNGQTIIGGHVNLSPFSTSAGNTSEIRFLELAANGTNYTAFKAADSLAQTTVYKLPSTDPTSGQLLSASAPSSGVVTLSWATDAGGTSIAPIGVAVSDETTALTTGTAKLTVRVPYGFTLSEVRASLTTVSSSGAVVVDINKNGSTILSTKLSIDQSEDTSVSAATPAVISDTAIADNDELTFDIDSAGTGATGLKVWLIPSGATGSSVAWGGITGTLSSQSDLNTALGLKAPLLSPVLTTPQINDTSSDHQYVFAVSELAADRTVTLPLLTGNDVFVFADFAQTLANKTLTTPTIASFTNATHNHTNAAGGGQLTDAALSAAVTVPKGGSGLTSLTAYAILAGGTTSTGNLQQVSGLGTSGQVLTSNGAGALPTWQAAAGGGANTALSNLASVAINTSLLSDTDNTDDLGSGAKRWANVFTTCLKAYAEDSNIIVASSGGSLIGRIQRNSSTGGLNVVADANELLLSTGGSGDKVVLQTVNTNKDIELLPTGNIKIGVALVSLGGGSAPTLGTIGGSGPATAAQNSWLQLKDSAGNLFWVPVWK